MGQVILDRVSMKFGDFTAVDNVSLEIESGEFFSFLGPSGCGKTTILRIISGFNRPTSGSVSISGNSMDGIGPNKRPTALIFQNLALFPLMSVADNIAFGLEVKNIGKKERLKKADELLELIALTGYGDKNINELSGGQKQRVAIARALAVEPQVLLLDEPLSALDLKLRQHMRSELRDIQKKTGVTFIYITHDQGEAMTMSDRVAVMSAGKIEQTGSPEEIYNNPSTPFTASFVGENNMFRGRVISTSGNMSEIETPCGRFTGVNTDGHSQGDEAVIFIRPERMAVAESASGNGHNIFSSTVSRMEFEGSFVNLFLKKTCAEKEISVNMMNTGDTGRFRQGDQLSISFSPDHSRVMKMAGRIS
ncbi:MAG: ABC transporter ATP-binding protein [Deferribacterales bacterium]